MVTTISGMSSSALRDLHAAMPVHDARVKSHPVALTVAQVPQFGEDVETEAVFEHSRNVAERRGAEWHGSWQWLLFFDSLAVLEVGSGSTAGSPLSDRLARNSAACFDGLDEWE